MPWNCSPLKMVNFMLWISSQQIIFLRVYTVFYRFLPLSGPHYTVVVKHVSYILPNNVVSPKSLRSSQTLVYISSLPVDGDNTTESLKDIIPCLKGACWSENWGNPNPRFLQSYFLKSRQNGYAKTRNPVLTMDILKTYWKGTKLCTWCSN